MTTSPPFERRVARHLARLGMVGSAVMLATSAIGLLPSQITSAAAAATDNGAAVITTPADGPDGGQPMASGDSATPFTLFLPVGSTCPGDSALGNYRVQSFMVPTSVDVSTLTFDAFGPTPQGVGTDFRQPLYKTGEGTPFVDAQTANADTPGGPGRIINIPAFDFASTFAAGNVPPAVYTLGIGCTLGTGADQLKTFWSVDLTVVAAAVSGSNPLGFTWTPVAGTGTTTTTTTAGGGTTTTTAGGGTTTTTSGGGTTTTTSGDGSTTTTSADGSTTTTAAGGVTTTTAAGGVSTNPLGGSLPTTGSSPAAMAMWAFFLLVCGRMAVVLSRPPKLKTPKA